MCLSLLAGLFAVFTKLCINYSWPFHAPLYNANIAAHEVHSIGFCLQLIKQVWSHGNNVRDVIIANVISADAHTYIHTYIHTDAETAK